MIRPLAIAAAVMFVGGGAAAQSGSAQHPIVVHMKRGTYAIRLTGVLRQNRDCCAYLFKAHAGQTLRWSVTGPAVRVTLTSPNGDTDGPGVPAEIALPADGAYVLTVHPNLMADGAFGRFKLNLSIPPNR